MSPAIQRDLSHLVAGAMPLQVVDPDAAEHEARHLAAAVMLNFLTPVYATAIPDPVAGYAGSVWQTDPFIAGAHEFTADELRKSAIVYTVGALGEPDWPPEGLPEIEHPRSDDEWRLRVDLDRLAVDEQDTRDVWAGIRAETLELAETRTFQMLEAAYARLLKAHGTLDEHTIRKTYEIVALGAKAVDTYTVNASCKTLKARGAFSLLFDVFSATARKPRTKSDTLHPIITALQQAGQHIPIQGVAGSILGDIDPIGDIDPTSLKVIDGMGIYCHGRMYTERAEAVDTLRSIKSGHIAVEYPPDLTALVLHRKTEVEPPPNPTFSEELAQLHEVAEAMRPRGERVSYRDRIQVELDAGTIDEDVARFALDFNDMVHQTMNAPHPTKTPDELRVECARIQRELAR